jgi:hypothetical protein
VRGITRADVRRKMIDATISARGYCVLHDGVTGEIFDAATGQWRPTWPEDLHSPPSLRLVK